MTDRELLERAAESAGMDAQWDCEDRGMMVLTPDGIDTKTWNPPKDDGDALRLAVKLGMEVFLCGTDVFAKVGSRVLVQQFSGPDRNAAVRRAVVRAAAELAS